VRVQKNLQSEKGCNSLSRIAVQGFSALVVYAKSCWNFLNAFSITKFIKQIVGSANVPVKPSRYFGWFPIPVFRFKHHQNPLFINWQCVSDWLKILKFCAKIEVLQFKVRILIFERRDLLREQRSLLLQKVNHVFGKSGCAADADKLSGSIKSTHIVERKLNVLAVTVKP
jgi:hypothetical protein